MKQTRGELAEKNLQRTLIVYFEESIREIFPSENFARFTRGKKDTLTFGYTPIKEGEKYEFSTHEWIDLAN